jgi:hypothetical protein
MAMSGYDRAVYSGTACTFNGRTGIYARDQHNRSAFRRQLGRVGFEFSDDPFVLLDDSGTMSVRDWGAFSPEFAIGGVYEADQPDVVTTTPGGFLTFLLMAQRVGPRRGAPELVALRSALGSIRGFNSASAESLAAALGELGA